ncbi:hypothetical protein [Moorena producens]
MQRIAIPSYLFPSWEGLGVGPCSQIRCSLFPKNQKFVPHKS